MKNLNKLLIFLFLLNVLMLESCGENYQVNDISVSDNLIDKKIKIYDTLKIKLSKSSKNLVFEIKSNNQIQKINPVSSNFENNYQYNFLRKKPAQCN